MKTLTNRTRSLTWTLIILPVVSMLNLQAQDYLISFAGSGGSTTVDSVIVENLTQGTILKMKGSDVLHLKGTVSIFETVSDNETGKISFYPNPMKDNAKMQFVLPESGETMITLHDLSGREIVQTRDLLSIGEHTYSIQGIKEGIYLVSVISGRYSFSGKLISSGSNGNGIKIALESSETAQVKQNDSKGISAETVMQYNTGDRLKLNGKWGKYTTIVTDIPEASKTITYNFIACTDGDGNNYPVVFISSSKGINDYSDLNPDKGTQVWMGENLRATKYLDGTNIPLVTDASSWTGLTTNGYCWYENDSKYKNVYGALYNYYAVIHAKLCPDGFHVPTDNDWTVLTNYLGGSFTGEGLKLKETGTTHWHSPNTGATNQTGFTARPGGMRTNVFNGLTYVGRWWSSTEETAPGKGMDNTGQWPPSSESKSIYVWYRSLDNEFANLWRGVNEKYWGLSVRCLKD